MRILSSLLLLAVVASTAFADIQDPPAKKYNATRKLGRGISNVAFGYTEIPSQMVHYNNLDGNAAAFSVGVVYGLRRFGERFGMGLYEIFTFPFAINNGSYKPYYRSPTRYHHNVYEEFPPELGFDTSSKPVLNYNSR
ncbi:MAG TPA: exosortase system-associated protein, TIGR04073 family [Chthoniobacterales bacterium]